ncbi:MAG: aminotransferase class I/II-fold pyridoxal phosphate-dependent enzyme [Magnetococcales bacterium]|nr:aminotransferase class I/II-fold pyridoxal phosphate-dependent enzyme [Magnetococcales bacterium]
MVDMDWAEKLDNIQPFYVMEVLRRADELSTQGRDIIHLEVGEPDFATPEPILAAARKALDMDQTKYSLATGSKQLREGIARWYMSQYGVEVSPQRIVITSGSSGAFMLAFGALLNPGDRFAISDPGYPCYSNMIQLLNAEPVRIPVGPLSNYQLNAALLQPELKKGLRGALVTSPSNPTGTLISEQDFSEVTTLIENHGGLLISDEIYHGITYGQSAQTALEFSDRAVVINGFSKYFAMTGWRLGWMIVPEDALGAVEMLQQNLFISASSISQYAAMAAFECGNVFQEQLEKYNKNRVFLLDALTKSGFEIAVEPLGAFYIYADISRLLEQTGIADSRQFCNMLLDEAGVGVTPGLDFGQHRPGEHLRFSYATSFANIQDGVARISEFIEKHIK